MAILTIENGHLGRAKVKNPITWERKFLPKSATLKPLGFSEDYAGKFKLSHARRTLMLAHTLCAHVHVAAFVPSE